MKRLIIGDIHGHWNAFKNIYDYEDPDSVIVLGDYFDNFHGEDLEIIDCFNNIKKLQQEHIATKNGEFILLIGNHDFHYFSGIEQYSGYRHNYATYAYYELNRMLDEHLIQYTYIDYVNKTIYSHAGVTNTWMNENNIDNLDYINQLSASSFRFTYKGHGDCYGDTKFSSPIWIRPNSLWVDTYTDETGYKWTQIVGHTHDDKPEIRLLNGKKCWCQADIDKYNKDGNRPVLYVMDAMPDWYMVEDIDVETELINKREVIFNI